MKYLLVLVIFFVVPHCQHAMEETEPELYSSSIVGLLKLHDLEKQFMLQVESYADALKEKIQTLQTYLKSIDRVAYETHKERENYVSNPLKAFALLRRIRQDWKALQAYTAKEVGRAQLDAMKELLERKPTDKDLVESLNGMRHIEQLYDLSAYDIWQGRLQGRQFNNKLTLRDCLVLANHFYANADYGQATLWYHIVLKYPEEPSGYLFDKVLSQRLDGVPHKFTRAMLYVTSKGITDLTHEDAHTVVEKILAENSAADLSAYRNEVLKLNYSTLSELLKEFKPRPTAVQLVCRGQNVTKRTNLSCRYNFTATPFLRLAPLKMEEVAQDPYIVLYHNVLYDSEIEDIQRQSVNQMINGYSGTLHKNQTEPVEIVARIFDMMEDTPLRTRLNQRIMDITGLDAREFPDLNMANYGLGTYFMPHYDYIYGERYKPDYNVKRLGERLASLIVYASDVSIGGATAFPEIQIAVKPQKGSALFWFNLFDDGTPDPRSLHAVCPVVVGSRWTLAKWFHTLPQMFIKPCSLKPHKQLA